MADATAVISVKKLKVAELKKELADRGLPTKGNKSDLQARLEQCLSEQGMVVSQDESEEIADEHDAEDDLDNDDLDDVDVGEDAAEHLGTEDLDIPTKEKEIIEDAVADEKEKQTTVSPVKRVPITPPGKTPGQVTVTDEQKKAKRLERFGQSPPETDTDKKQARAQRFGLSSPASNGSTKSSPIVGPKDIDLEKLKQRAQRFGAVSPAIAKLEEKDRLLKRKERFGVAVTASPGDMSEAKKKRAERFGL
ncbi:hypothetical protein ACROYT_G026690 [Oculina patagonica]